MSEAIRLLRPASQESDSRIGRLQERVDFLEAELARIRQEAARHEQDVVSALSRRVVAVQEEERRRLASIVHDLISPNLAAVKIHLGTIAADLPPSAPADLDAQLADTRALLDDTVASLHALSTDLRPVTLDYAGLYSALDSYAHQFSRRTGIAVQVRGGKTPARLPADLESLLFRIAQEALANCARHAQAGEVRIELDHDAQHAVLQVSDDGVGFEAAELASYGHPSGSGIATMRERAEFAGGQFHLESRPGLGTRIRVEI